LQTGFASGSGFLPLGSGLDSDSKKIESEHLCCTVIGLALDWEPHKSLKHDHECLTELLERAYFSTTCDSANPTSRGSLHRWMESLLQTPTPLLFQNFWIRSGFGNFSNLRILLLFRLPLKSSIQP